MITQLAVTDLTRMQRGHVCIAGYDTKQNCIRLVRPRPQGIPELSLVVDNKAIAFPFAVIEVDLLNALPDPPHVEDHLYVPQSLRFLRRVDDARKERFLGWSLHHSLADLFGQPVLQGPGYYVMAGQGVRSLGTIQPSAIKGVEYHSEQEGSWSYHIVFKDDVSWYRLKITDLTWHYYCDLYRADGREPSEIASEMTTTLKRVKVYLRIGLARGWQKYPDRCYVQVNGIHTIPDYLNGRTFVELMSVSRK